MTHRVDAWEKCYTKAWGKAILLEATGHPAKFSRSLIERIYEHVVAEGWVHPGAVVLDPFAGCGLGALDAMRHGLTWVGVELEPKWWELGAAEYDCPGFDADFWRRYSGRAEYISLLRECFALCPQCETALQPITKIHKRTGKVQERRIPERDAHRYRGNLPAWAYKHRHIPGWGRATLLQGDSRRLRAVIGGAALRLSLRVGLCCSSPPYAESEMGGKQGGEGQNTKWRNGKIKDESEIKSRSLGKGYGDDTPGQIAALPPGDLQAALSITSPAYRQTTGGVNVTQESGVLSDPALVARHAAGNAAAHGYGAMPGQIANLPEGEWSLTITSPPYAESLIQKSDRPETENTRRINEMAGNMAYGSSPAQLARLPEGAPLTVTSPPWEDNVDMPESRKDFLSEVAKQNGNNKRRQIAPEGKDYGETPGNIGNESGETFWSAALAIVRETFAALCPGAHAVFVVKSYVRDSKLVDFPGQWRALCESVGFIMLHEHHALLSEEHGEQMPLDGGNGKRRGKDKVSFFRRLQVDRDKARAYWPSVSNKVTWIDLAYDEKIAAYEKAKARNPKRKPPSEKTILTHAQKLAYVHAGKPGLDVETEIKFETVLCMLRP